MEIGRFGLELKLWQLEAYKALKLIKSEKNESKVFHFNYNKKDYQD